MEINRNDLIPTEQNLLDVWESFFASPGWALVMQRYTPRLEATVSDLENAEDLKALGRARGQRDLLLEITQLESLIETEFLSVVGAAQAERQEDLDSRGAMA
jgi:hypothetical protein